ncbi:MAG: alpha/beta fold hydrolase [Clostridia bacterium]|nr:alpha/beta fold hydrolase [Clostridia bacterium]
MSVFEKDGLKFFYELKGNVNGNQVIVFLNGVMASTSSWDFQVPVFERLGFKILVHDFRGQLMSDKPKGTYSFKIHAGDTIALLDHLGIKKAHFIGTSYGGEVAMRLAIDYPERTETISIIDSVSQLDESLKLFIESWIGLAKSNDGQSFFQGILPTIYHNTYIQNNKIMLEKRSERMKDIPSSYFDGQVSLYKTFLEDVEMTEELDQITCPTLVVCGENDILKPIKFSQIISEKIKGAEFAIIPDCGHVTIFEKPDVLNSILLGFVVKHI